MHFLSTRGSDHDTSFQDAVKKGLAVDGGLYFPSRVPAISMDEFERGSASLPEIALRILKEYTGSLFSQEALLNLLQDALNFPIPLVEVEENIFSLELFHGPTLAFKDIGARCFGRILPNCNTSGELVHVLTATSGDTGGAVANGLYGIEGVRALVLYPKNKVSPLQERQFATLGGNITAIAVDGVFDDCQRLVKSAFADEEIRANLTITTANSINIARWLPQVVYYYWMYKQIGQECVISVPSGNLGNLTAGILAGKMGLPHNRFIAACNANDTVHRYLDSGQYLPHPSIQTVANAMDVGDPSNFERLLALYAKDYDRIHDALSSFNYSDGQIVRTIARCYNENGYLLDPHGACGYQALKDSLRPGETGVFLATAHPAKFAEVYASAGIEEPKHPVLEGLRHKEVLSESIGSSLDDLRQLLLSS